MELDEFIELVKEQQGIDLSGVLTTADKIGRPQSSLDREASTISWNVIQWHGWYVSATKC